MMFLKLSGPIVTICGIAFITLFVTLYPPTNNLTSAWLVWSLLTFSQVLPLVGLGIGYSLVSLPLILFSFAVFVGGFFMGFINYKSVWIYFVNRADTSDHLYLTLPISSLFVGILLLVSQRVRQWLVLPISAVIGTMFAVSIRLTDPTLHDGIIPKLGLMVSVWIILSSTLNIRFFYKKWFIIPIRILGSWLMASAILYGGVALGVKYGYIVPKSTIKKEQIPDVDLVPDFTR